MSSMHGDENLEQIRQDERDRFENPQVLDSLRYDNTAREPMKAGEKTIRERISATGMPVGSIVAIERPHNYSVDLDGHPNNPQTERYLRAVGMLKPYATEEGLLEAVEIENQKVDYRPDFPTLEMNYSEPNGLVIEMSIRVPDEMRKYYDMDMALNSLGHRMSTLLQDLKHVKQAADEADQIDAEPVATPTDD